MWLMSGTMPWYQTPERSGCPSASRGVGSFFAGIFFSADFWAMTEGKIMHEAAAKMSAVRTCRTFIGNTSTLTHVFPLFIASLLLQLSQDFSRVQVSLIGLRSHRRNTAVRKFDVLGRRSRYSVFGRTCSGGHRFAHVRQEVCAGRFVGAPQDIGRRD